MPRTTHGVGGIWALLSVLTAGADAAQVDPIFADGFESAPLLHYLFDGDGVNIGTLSGYDMTVVGAGYDVGKFGQSLSFGTGGYGDVSGMRVAVGSLAKVTVGFWYYMSAPLPDQTIWTLDNNSTLPYGGIQLGDDGAVGASVCVSTTTSRYVGGSCGTFAAPPTGEWHHWIIRYEGTGTGAGEGGPVAIYIDDVPVFTQVNDPSNDPVFSSAIPDVLYVDGNGARMDDLRIYGDVFSQAQQCSYIIGGAWTGSGCTLP